MSSVMSHAWAGEAHQGGHGPIHVADEDFFLSQFVQPQKWVREDAFMGSDGRTSFSLDEGDQFVELRDPELTVLNSPVDESFLQLDEHGGIEGWFEENADLAQWIDSPQSAHNEQLAHRIELAAEKVDWESWGEYLFDEPLQHDGGCGQFSLKAEPLDDWTEESKPIRIKQIKQEILNYEEQKFASKPSSSGTHRQQRKKNKKRETQSAIDKRRELNRRAAQRYRGRKKEEWEALLEEGVKLESRNAYLRPLVKELQKKIDWYKKELAHKAIEAGRKMSFPS